MSQKSGVASTSSAKLVPVQVIKKTKTSLSTSVSKFECLASSSSDSDGSVGSSSAPPAILTSSERLDGSEKKKWRRTSEKKVPTQPTVPEDDASEADAVAPSATSAKSSSVFSAIAPNQATKGQYANVFWRSVPMDELREHPNFHELPLPDQVVVSSLKDLTLFRQDSWQWDALHQGRLTTSKLASILGFYERQCGKYLNIPNSLQGHDRAVSAWDWLRRKPPASWEHLLSEPQDSSAASISNRQDSSDIWSKKHENHKFAYSYQPSAALHTKLSANYKINCPSSARMAWGSVQESTAILALVNYLLQNDTTAQVHESGMCVFEALEEVSSSADSTSEVDKLYQKIQKAISIDKTLPLLGASPDALIRYDDGRIEVVEVKCFSPFVSNDRRDGSGKNTALAVSLFRPAGEQLGSIPVWHIPQIQLEMFCAGAACESALLIVLYVDGAKIYRIARDTEYTMEMLQWAQDFFQQFVLQVPANKMKPPPENFFQPHQTPRYAAFLQRTLQLAQSAACVAELSHEDIQRSPHNLHFFV